MARYSREAPMHLRKAGWGAGLGGRRRDLDDSQAICISCLIRGKRQLPPKRAWCGGKASKPNITQRLRLRPFPPPSLPAVTLIPPLVTQQTHSFQVDFFPYHEKNISTSGVILRLTGKISEASPLKSGGRSECLTISKMVLEVLANMIGQEKEVRHKS